MANQGQFVSSSSLIGRSKECQNRVKDSLTLLAKCTKLKNSLARMGQLLCTAGKSEFLFVPQMTIERSGIQAFHYYEL